MRYVLVRRAEQAPPLRTEAEAAGIREVIQDRGVSANERKDQGLTPEG